MKTYLLIAVLSVSIPFGWQPKIETENTNYFPEFLECYDKVRHWEGNYAYLEFDRGGETYAGIARNFNRNWEGWKTLDVHKKDSGTHWNKRIKELEEHVVKYYYNVYVSEGFYKIKDPFVRNYLFDYRNSGTIAYRHMKYVLNEHGFQVGKAAVLDESSIQAINKINPLIFILHLKEVRMDYYTQVAINNPDLEIYLKGWIKRAKHINS